MRALFLCAVCAGVVGCSKQPLAPTDDSRTKAAFAIWEWALTPGYDEGFSVVVFDGTTRQEALTCKAGEAVRSLYLQKSPESGEFLVKIDAGNGGFYGGVIGDPFSGRVPLCHKTPVNHEGLWVLVNDRDAKAGSDGLMSAYIAISFSGEGDFEPIAPADADKPRR